MLWFTLCPVYRQLNIISTASLEKFLFISNAFLCFSSSLNAELIIPATGNVFYAMTSSSVDFLLRRKGGNTPLGSQPISTETSATFPRIKAKGRRLVRTLFWNQPGFRWSAVIFFLTWRQVELSQTVHEAFSVQNKNLHMPFFLLMLLQSSFYQNTKTKSSLCFNPQLHSRFCQTFQTSGCSALLTRAVCSFPLFQTVCITNLHQWKSNGNL